MDTWTVGQRPPEKPRLNPAREAIRETLLGPGWRILFAATFVPTLAHWRDNLLWNPNLSDEDRRVFQRAMAVLWEGFRTAYEKAELTPPAWLRKEFFPDER